MVTPGKIVRVVNCVGKKVMIAPFRLVRPSTARSEAPLSSSAAPLSYSNDGVVQRRLIHQQRRDDYFDGAEKPHAHLSYSTGHLSYLYDK
jgi:hypothetical protein